MNVRTHLIRSCACWLTLAMLPLAANVARSETRTWLGGGGIWDNNLHWSDELQPFAGDKAVIPSGTPLVNTLERIDSLDVAAGAAIDIPGPGTLEVISGNATNDGRIEIGAGTSGQLLIGPGTLDGGGEVVLVNSDFAGTGGARLNGPTLGSLVATHAAGHTVRGEGTMAGNWINHGLIRAEETSGDASATLRLIGNMTHHGSIRSSATGSIQFSGVVLTQAAGAELVADTEPIRFVSGSITGGTLAAINGGVYAHANGGSITLAGVTIEGEYRLTPTALGGSLNIAGSGIVNNATITVDNNGTNQATVFVNSAATISGAGQLILNRESADVRITGIGSVVNGPAHTIRGAGRVQIPIANEGTILAEPRVGGGVLTLLSAPIENRNLLGANAGGTLRLRDLVVTQDVAAGRIRAADGGVVELAGVNVVGGRIQTDGAGVVQVGATGFSNQAFFTDVTNEGLIFGRAGSLTRLSGATFTNHGTLQINQPETAGFTALQIDAPVTLQGPGTIELNRTGAQADIVPAASDIVLTQAADHTIRGQGRISVPLVNHGRLEGISATELLEINNTLRGDGVLANVQISGRTHIVGDVGTAAVVALEGRYQLNNFSRVQFDLAGPLPGSGYDQLLSTDPANTIAIGATGTRLEVALAGGYMPAGGETFTLISTAGTIGGNFNVVSLPTLLPGLSWQNVSAPGSIAYRVSGTISYRPGDIDLDGDVDRADAAAFARHFGRETLSVWDTGDFNADGRTDLADLALLQQNFTGQGPSASAMAVPEPSSAILAAGAVLLLFGSSRAKRRASK